MPGRIARLRSAATRRLGRYTPGDSAPAGVAELAALTADRRHDEAVALARDLLAKYPDNQGVVRQVRASAVKAGAMTLLHEATAIQADKWPSEDVAARLREQEGRLRETSSDYLPVIEAPVGRVAGTPGRVLHVLKISMPYRQSGYSVRTQYALAAQHEVGLDPIGVTALDFPRSIGITDAPDTDAVAGVTHVRLFRGDIPAREPADQYLDAWASHLAPVVAARQPELLHAHSGHRGFDTALVTLSVARETGLPFVYEVRGFFESLWTSDVEWAERSETYDRRWETERRVMDAADAVVTLSESMKADIVSRGIAADKVHVVPNGVDADAFAPRERDRDLAARWGLDGSFVFGYVSNLDHYREGHELLIEAAANFAERGIDAKALIVGGGSRAEELQELAKARGAQDNVVFTGKVPHDEVLDYYALHDVFVIPRVDERAARLVTPLKPFEAMAAGIPVLVSDLPALTEITGQGERGASFVAGDADDLTAQLDALRLDPDRRAELAGAAMHWVRTERSWLANGRRYQEVYARVLSAGSTPKISE